MIISTGNVFFGSDIISMLQSAPKLVKFGQSSKKILSSAQTFV